MAYPDYRFFCTCRASRRVFGRELPNHCLLYTSILGPAEIGERPRLRSDLVSTVFAGSVERVSRAVLSCAVLSLSVSYTHLDVYKRQRLINALLLIVCIAVGLSATLMIVKNSLL